VDERSQPGDDPEPGDRGPRRPAFDLSAVDIEALMRMLQSPGPVNWEVASQVATMVAADDDRAPRSDERSELEGLARAALTHVVGETGLTAAFGAPVRILGRDDWARCTSTPSARSSNPSPARWRRRSGRRGAGSVEPDEAGVHAAPTTGPFGLPFDPEAFAGIMGLMAPMLLGMQGVR